MLRSVLVKCRAMPHGSQTNRAWALEPAFLTPSRRADAAIIEADVFNPIDYCNGSQGGGGGNG